MFDEGSWWQPPPHNILTGGMPECLYHTAFDGGLPAERPVVSIQNFQYFPADRIEISDRIITIQFTEFRKFFGYPGIVNSCTIILSVIFFTFICFLSILQAKSRKRKYSSSEDEEEDRKEIKTKWRGVLSTAERDELEVSLISFIFC